jgi:hypothetical protein
VREPLVSNLGAVADFTEATGAIGVNAPGDADCAGSVSLTPPPLAGIRQSNFVIDKGRELRLIDTSTGRVLVGSARRP